MKMVALKLSILAVVAAFASGLDAQNRVVSLDASGAATIDSARLTTVSTLDVPWRFSATDDPKFADPNFDDSAWPLIKPGDEKSFAERGLPDSKDGRCWMRLHLRLTGTQAPIAMLLTLRSIATQYKAYANAREIGATKGFEQNARYLTQPFRLPLPQETTVILAIHFTEARLDAQSYIPVDRVAIGPNEAIGLLADLKRYKAFEEFRLSDIVVGLLFLSLVPVSLSLWFIQNRRKEYIWLAVFCLVNAAQDLVLPAMLTGAIPANKYGAFLVTSLPAALLEYVVVLSNLKRWSWLWLTVRCVQILAFLQPLAFEFGAARVGQIILSGSYLALYLLVPFLLFRAYRRGSTECGVLFVATGVGSLGALYSDFLKYLHGSLAVFRVHLRGVGVAYDDISNLLLAAGLAWVILLRFSRVSKEEQVAATELEAARSVQQLLIPADTPVTPGFKVDSVYLPARTVSGDFFLVLPAADQSLLAVIGDVSGKGLEAAMVVSAIIGALRLELSREPAALLAQLNRMLTGHIKGFATCCAILIAKDGRFQIANAGNPSPYLNGAEIETTPGLPIGITLDATYEETGHVVPDRGQLTFVSDGVLEATCAKTRELFGFERTTAISDRSASQIAEIAAAFGTGAPQADDITVLTITRE